MSSSFLEDGRDSKVEKTTNSIVGLDDNQSPTD